eukprot:SAG31_NODE_884_length_11256_cov_2.889666_12_plen_59_part_00
MAKASTSSGDTSMDLISLERQCSLLDALWRLRYNYTAPHHAWSVLDNSENIHNQQLYK